MNKTEILKNYDHKPKFSFSEIWEKHNSAIVTFFCLIFILLAWVAEGNSSLHFLRIPFYLLAYIIGGYQKAYEGLETLIKEKDLDVDLLMVVAAIGAASIGYWMDGAILIFIFTLSGTLEGYTMERSNKDISSILKLRPEEALVLVGELEQKVKVEELKIGDRVIVKPGDRIPADGIITEGYSAINQASITGESIPVDKIPSNEVFAGTINGQGSLLIEVTKTSEATLLAKIIRLVQEAQSEMPPSQLFVERFESIYAKTIVVSAILLMILPPLLLGWTWDKTIYKAMIFLVVASPCALVSSIMPVILSAISNGARNGILFKGGVHLEHIGQVKVIAFDKTGTLTQGKPIVTDIIPFQEYSQEALLTISASLELLSEHPIAKSIVNAAREKNLTLERASNLQAIPGFGVHGIVHDKVCEIGKELLKDSHNISKEQIKIIQMLEEEGKTVIFTKLDQEIIGFLAIQDTPRPQAKESIQLLKNKGMKVVMLTGDSTNTAKSIAKSCGIDEIYSELLPEDKVKVIKELSQKYGKVAMVGDGVNDAPALATASVGIAMGAAGTDVALETANIILMSDDISKVAYAISLGQKTSGVIKQNLTFALIVIVSLITANFFNGINLPSGVVGHEGSTFLVILSGLRLLR
ncbi:MAG: heavy metal translocating P-type ATPase [Candidatus Sericytochromatia bacterium]|nr:heavy metal translocating P-type ATPase [Candidatus Sericytochromatia bacterium]